MAIKVQALCCSYTVKESCIIRVRDSAHSADITIPSGRYWTDDVYGSALKQASSPCLLGEFAYLIENNATHLGGTIGKDYATATSLFVATRSEFSDDAEEVYVDGTHANNTEEGRRAIKRMGMGPLAMSSTFGDLDTFGIIQGIWHAGEGEFGTLQEDPEDNGSVLLSSSGIAYGFAFGEGPIRRLVRFSGLSERTVFKKGQIEREQNGSTDVGSDYSLQTRLWEPLKRGEAVRLYEDRTATRGYVTAAVTATATSISVNTTSFANSTIIYLDGEPMYVVSGGGTTTLTVDRAEPVAHSAYAPVSTDFVATYVLDTDGGNVNRRRFGPTKRGPARPYYDVDLPLIRTVF